MADLPETTDILIVGAGPTGLALAAALRQLSLAPLIIDKQAEGANTSRAAVVHARTLEVLAPLGIADDLITQGVKTTDARVRDRDRELIHISFAGLDTPYPFALLCPQNRTEAVLLRHLRQSGGDILRPATLTALQPDADGVTATITRDDIAHTVRAKYVIGADGGHSIVRTQAGIEFVGGNYPQTFGLADVIMDWPLPGIEISLFLSARGVTLVAPLPGDHFRIVATLPGAAETPTLADMQRILDEDGPTAPRARIREVAWASRFHIQHRVSATPRRDRLLLCGDAAHVHSPAGGQGMNTGIQDGVALAAPLAEALRTGNTAPLDAWAASRHRIAKRIVSQTDRLTRIATVRSAPLRTLRNAAMTLAGRMPMVRRNIAWTLAELDNR